MDINQIENFRKQVLALHYELSEGDTLMPVSRPKVAERLGLGSDYNNDKLLTAIQYLDEKHLLEASTNMEDRITVQGVDMVELWLKQRAEAEKGLNNLLGDIERALDLAGKGILESPRLKEVRDTTKKRLGEIVSALDEENQLRYKKLAGGWTFELKPGFVSEQGTKEELEPWKKLIEEIQSNSFSPMLKTSVYVPTGESFTGRKTLRLILKKAKNEIWLQDNFLHPEILIVLQPYIEKLPTLKIHLLTRQNSSNFKSFESDYKLFAKQYPGSVEAKHNNQCHGRFIILDSTEVYSSGHSLHDLGNKADIINGITEPVAAQNAISDFSDWWSTGTTI